MILARLRSFVPPRGLSPRWWYCVLRYGTWLANKEHDRRRLLA